MGKCESLSFFRLSGSLSSGSLSVCFCLSVSPSLSLRLTAHAKQSGLQPALYSGEMGQCESLSLSPSLCLFVSVYTHTHSLSLSHTHTHVCLSQVYQMLNNPKAEAGEAQFDHCGLKDEVREAYNQIHTESGEGTQG